MDWRALGYGVAAFFAGHAVMAIAVSVMATVGMYASGGALMQVMSYLVPVVAGFVAARKATRRRVLVGIVGGAIGVVPIVLLPMLVMPDYSANGMLVIVASYALLAALGAVFGDHLGRKAAG